MFQGIPFVSRDALFEASQKLEAQDKARYFRTHLQELQEIVLPEIPLQPSSLDDEPKQGFALASRQTNPKVSPEVYNFVKQIFDEGQRTNQKKTMPEIVEEIQRKFQKEFWIKQSQVKNLVTKFKAENLKCSKASSDPDIVAEELTAEAEDELDQELLTQAMAKAKDTLNSTQKWLTSHPIQVLYTHSINHLQLNIVRKSNQNLL